MMATNVVNTDVPVLARLQQRALIVGVIGLLAGAAGAVANPDQFFRSWLVGFLFCLGLTMGSLGLLMMQHLSGGQWGLIGRRVFEAASRTLPIVALLFVPILFGLPRLFEWAHPERVSGDAVLQQKAPYLNVPFFVGRAVIYFLVWLLCAWLLNKWSAAQDRQEVGVTRADTRRFRVVSAPGLLAYCLTMTFAAVDWIMSLDPHWFSTIFGLLMVGGQGLSAFALVIAILALLSETEPVSSYLKPRHFHDLGKLLLAFVMLWAYFSFSQFLIIWGGNLPEETPWYLKRTTGGWGAVALLIVFGHFILPFMLLLSRNLKENRARLAMIAVFILVMRYVDLLWLVEPNFAHSGFPIHWMDLAVPAGLVGVWLFLFARQLRNRTLLPLSDPYSRRRSRMTRTDPQNAGTIVHHYTEEELHHLDVAHEESDVNVRAVLMFAVGLAVVTIVSAVAMWGLFSLFERQAAARDPQVSPLALPATEMPRTTTGSPFFGGAPQPQLLTNEPAALGLLHQSEAQRLDEYGWVDEPLKVARIPIDEAKKRLIERGVRTRGGAIAPWAGTHAFAYGESSGGRGIPVGQR